MPLSKEMCMHIFANAGIERQRALVSILTELNSAIEKHPQWPKDNIHSAAIVCEEAGELIRAALQVQYENGKFHHMHDEAIQTGAMALRFLIETKKKGGK